MPADALARRDNPSLVGQGFPVVVSLDFSTRKAKQLSRRLLVNGRPNRYGRNWRTYIDGRTRAAVEIRRLAASYERQLGDAARNPLTQRKIQELSETEVVLSRLRAELLSGTFTDVLAVNRLTNTVTRIRASLGLGGVSEPDSPAATDLAALLEAE
jgi:hypothetical protein